MLAQSMSMLRTTDSGAATEADADADARQALETAEQCLMAAAAAALMSTESAAGCRVRCRRAAASSC